MNNELIKFLQEKEAPGNWLKIAEQFKIPGNRKQKSDYVRRLWKKVHKPYTESYVDSNGNNVSVAGYGKGYPSRVITLNQPLKPEDVVHMNVPKTYIRLRQLDPRVQQMVEEWEKKTSTTSISKDHVLVIGDIHEPFCKEGYLEFCKTQRDRFGCTKIVFIGDLIDNHAQSFHNTDPDGLSAKDELLLAIKKLKAWYEAFPEATVILGNHDRIIARKLFSVGVSQRWMKPLEEILEVPNWKFVEQTVINDVLYLHGEGGTALKKAQSEMCSVVQGHLHSEGSIHLLNGGKSFAMQVGCGIDFNSYAFAYAQRGKKPILSCGVVLDRSPIIVPFHD